MKLIKLTSYSDNSPIYININEIGHIYEGKISKMNCKGGGFEMVKFTSVGVTTHNDGFSVKETPEEIIEKIRMIHNNASSTYIML
jgi:hypothetical protein